MIERVRSSGENTIAYGIFAPTALAARQEGFRFLGIRHARRITR